jgi:hypothetical protein
MHLNFAKKGIKVKKKRNTPLSQTIVRLGRYIHQGIPLKGRTIKVAPALVILHAPDGFGNTTRREGGTHDAERQWFSSGCGLLLCSRCLGRRCAAYHNGGPAPRAAMDTKDRMGFGNEWFKQD